MAVVGARGVAAWWATAGGAGPSWRAAPATRSARRGLEEGALVLGGRARRGGVAARARPGRGRKEEGKKERKKRRKEKGEKGRKEKKKNRKRKEIENYGKDLERILEKLEEFLGKLEEGFLWVLQVFRASA
jgi:hypothetical protein